MSKTVRCQIRFSEEELGKIEGRAVQMGLSVTEWLRGVAIDALDYPKDHYQFPRGRMERKMFELLLATHDLVKTSIFERKDGAEILEKARERTQKHMTLIPFEPVSPVYLPDEGEEAQPHLSGARGDS